MAATGLLKDKNMKDMPTVPKAGTLTVNFDSATTSNRSTAIPGNVCFVRATAECWIKRGPVTVTGVAVAGAEAFIIGPNDGWVDYDIRPGFEYIAPLAETGDGGILYIIYTDEARN
jgi:hypothetical protein